MKIMSKAKSSAYLFIILSFLFMSPVHTHAATLPVTAAACGTHASGTSYYVWTGGATQVYGSRPATAAECPYGGGGSKVTVTNFYQDYVCTNGVPSAKGAPMSQTTDSWQTVACMACGTHAPNSSYPITKSSTTSTRLATPAECPYGGHVPTQTTTVQNMLCTSGSQSPQGAAVVTTSDAGSPVCNPASSMCGTHLTGSEYYLWMGGSAQTFGARPATVAECAYGGFKDTVTNYFQDYVCTNGVQKAKNAPINQTTDSWQAVACNKAAMCGTHVSGTTYTLQTSQTAGNRAATTAECANGGTVPTLAAADQTYACLNGVQTPQGALLNKASDAGAPVCAPLANTEAATLSPATLSSSLVYPSNKIVISSTLTAKTQALTNIPLQTVIQSTDGSVIGTMGLKIGYLAVNTSMPVSFAYTVPDNTTLPPGKYEVLQGYPLASGGMDVISTSNFVVPAATVTLNEQFDDGRTALNTSVWNTFMDDNLPMDYVDSIETPDEVQTIPGQGLILRADKRTFQGFHYTVGMLSSQTKFSQTYGHFEMNAKVAQGAGMYSSFWMLPVDVTLNSDQAEIDIFEHPGIYPNAMLQTLHHPNQIPASSYSCVGPEDWALAYHVYGFDWTPTSAVFSIDGVPCYSQTTGIPNGPMYLIAGMAVGGVDTWGGAPNATTVLPNGTQIKYIKAWQYAGMPAELEPNEAFGPITVTPANPKPGDMITINGTIKAGSHDLTNVYEGFAAYESEHPENFYYGQQANPLLNVPAHTSVAYHINYKLPATMPVGMYNFYVQSTSKEAAPIQLLNAQSILVGDALPSFP